MLAWSTGWTVTERTGQTALALVLCGLVQVELGRQLAARPVAGSGVSAVAVWLIAAALTLPLAGIVLVAVILHTHELVRGPRRDDQRPSRVLTSVGGAVLAGLVLSARNWSFPADAVTTVVIIDAALAGALYLAVAEGPALLRAARRLSGDERAADEPSFGVTRVALGVLAGLVASVAVLAVPLVLLPVACLRRSAHGRELHHAAAHDGKTLLLNHAAWQARGSAVLASHRTRAHTAVLMVDVDHFKRLNDTYGHHAGDDVLTSVAHVLQTTTRRNDIVARFGGDEFTLLLPGVTEEEAAEAAERIRHQIGVLTVITTNLHGRPTTISGITASIGVATTHHTEPSLEELMVRADRSLYQAKELGRDRVCGLALAVAA